MAILEKVKTQLDISEGDYSQDEKINLIIEEGKARLRKTNPSLTDEDFENPTQERFLLLQYCLYAFSNAAEMFFVNYSAEILLLRQEYEVSSYEPEE